MCMTQGKDTPCLWGQDTGLHAIDMDDRNESMLSFNRIK